MIRPISRVVAGSSTAPMPMGSGKGEKSPLETVWPAVTVKPWRGSVLIFSGMPHRSASAAACRALCWVASVTASSPRREM
jgi:hypothetical protein